MRRRPLRLLAAGLAAVALVGPQLGGAEAVDPLIVTGGASAAYNAGTLASPASTPASYTGEALVLQTASVGRGAAEPTIGVDRNGSAFYAAGEFDGKFVVLPRTFIMRSTDGGRTWVKASPEIATTGEPLPPVTADPYVLTDPDTGRVFNPELDGACLFMNFSDDGGKNWTTNPLSCGTVVVDHQTVAVGPPPASLEPLMLTYPNVVYHCSNRVADSICGRSLDGGLTWHQTGTPAYLGFDPAAGGVCGGLHGHLDTDSKGRMFLPKGHCEKPYVSVSEDGGTTWKRVLVSDKIGARDTHLAVATDDADNVYMLWTDPATRLPWLAISTDHGSTFGAPMMVAPPGVKEAEFAVLEAGEAGKIAINFLGNTVGKAANKPTRPWNQYLIVSTDMLSANPTFVSTTANPVANPIIRGECSDDATGGRCGGIWDFVDIIVSPLDGDFWATTADGCTTTACTKSGGTDQNAQTGIGLAIRQMGGPRIRTITPVAPTTTIP